MSNSVIFHSAISSARPRGVHVIEAYSPKLGRRLQCFGEHAFGQWIRLEADPSIQPFCGRLAYLNFAAGKRLMHFSVRRDDRQMLMIVDAKLTVLTIPPAELADVRTAVASRERRTGSTRICSTRPTGVGTAAVCTTHESLPC